MKPHNNNSIRRRDAIVKGKNLELLLGDCVHFKAFPSQEFWDPSTVTSIYSSERMGGPIAKLLTSSYYWDIPIKDIYWQPLLMRWEYVLKVTST